MRCKAELIQSHWSRQVSPCATDLEHSLSTLRTSFSLSGRPDSAVAETRQDCQVAKRARPVPPRRWNAAQVPAAVDWDRKQVQHGRHEY